MKEEHQSVFPPDRVSVSVEQLHKLQEDSAMLAALFAAGVEQWSGYKKAIALLGNDPDIIDIKQGWNNRR